MPPNSPLSFFKILIDASAPNLPLPPDFITKHLKNKIPKDPIIIRSANGGYSWKLKIKKVGEFYCFTHGWNNVVKDINLGFGDFMVFQLVDQSSFKMMVFSPNGCEKHLPSKIKVEHDDDDDVVDDGGDPFFLSIMSKSHINILRLPAEFVGLPGIDDEGTITMKNLDGKEWPMVVKLDKSYRSSTRYYLASGWPDFMRSNELSEGDECVFKFIKSENKLCLAKVTKNTRNEDECVEVVKRPRGRPSKRKTGVMKL